MAAVGNELSGGILAGGEGRRFGGADKGWLEYQGRPFVEIVLERLKPQAADIVISANRSADRYSKLVDRVFADRIGAGPLAGLLRLLETALHDWLLCVPCDALDLPLDLADTLFAEQRRTAADIVVLSDEDGVHPTMSLSRCSLATDLEGFLAEGGSRVSAWQARHRLAIAHIPGRLANINDVQSLDRLAGDAHG